MARYPYSLVLVQWHKSSKCLQLQQTLKSFCSFLVLHSHSHDWHFHCRFPRKQCNRVTEYLMLETIWWLKFPKGLGPENTRLLPVVWRRPQLLLFPDQAVVADTHNTPVLAWMLILTDELLGPWLLIHPTQSSMHPSCTHIQGNSTSSTSCSNLP